MQYVGVVFRTGPPQIYSYEWEGEEPLKVGQRVVVPPNYWNSQPSFGDVAMIYASREKVNYKGVLAKIMEVVPDEV